MSKPNKKFKLLPTLFIGFFLSGLVLLGVFSGLFAWKYYLDIHKFLAKATRVEGKVVSYSTKISSSPKSNNLLYCPHIEFTTKAGRDHSFTADTCTSWQPKVGREIIVLYDPKTPAKARVNYSLMNWLPIVIFAGGSFFLITIPGILLILIIVSSLYKLGLIKSKSKLD